MLLHSHLTSVYLLNSLGSISLACLTSYSFLTHSSVSLGSPPLPIFLSLWLLLSAASACHWCQCNFGRCRTGWLRQSPPPQEQENTEETGPRETLPDTSPSGSPMPKLQRQLQIRLHRLPDYILQSSLYKPVQLGQRAEQCIAQSHLYLSHRLPRPAISLSLESSMHFPELHKTETHPASTLPLHSTMTLTAQCPSELSQDETLPKFTLPPCLQKDSTVPFPFKLPKTTTHSNFSLLHHQVKDFRLKPPLLRLHRLCQSAVESALRLHNHVRTLSTKQNPKSMLHLSPKGASSKLSFQGEIDSGMQNPDLLTERAANDKIVQKTVQKLQHVVPHMQLQDNMHKKRDDAEWAQPEEEEGPVKRTVVKNCPATDAHCVLHSQNPAESASANGLAGLTNGVPQKGLLQSKHKIRVDFKVSFCSTFFLYCVLELINNDFSALA